MPRKKIEERAAENTGLGPGEEQAVNPNPKGEDRSRARSRTSGRDLDQTGWRRELQAAKVKFDDEAKEIFLRELAQSDRLHSSSRSAGVCLQTVRNHIDNDPEFAEAVLEAKAAYKDRVLTTMQLVALDGVEEPIIGGQFKDEVVATKRVFATNILAMEMKRVDPAYKERDTVDLNVRGGVLRVRQKMTTEEWELEFGSDQDAKAQPEPEQPTIETTAKEVE